MIAAITKAEAGQTLSPREQKLFDKGQQLIRIVHSNPLLATLNRIAQQTVEQRGIRTDGPDLQGAMRDVVDRSPLSQSAADILERLTNNS